MGHCRSGREAEQVGGADEEGVELGGCEVGGEEGEGEGEWEGGGECCREGAACNS